jgi:hypothetical protein
MAPTCAHCVCKIAGHDVEADGGSILRALREHKSGLKDPA